MPLTDAQKERLKSLTSDERAEFLEALGGKGDGDLLKTVEILQSKVDAMEKASKRKGSEERRKGGSSWFDAIFGGG